MIRTNEMRTLTLGQIATELGLSRYRVKLMVTALNLKPITNGRIKFYDGSVLGIGARMK